MHACDATMSNKFWFAGESYGINRKLGQRYGYFSRLQNYYITKESQNHDDKATIGG